MRKVLSLICLFVLVSALMIFTTGCTKKAEKVTVTFWHIDTLQEGKDFYQKIADDYMKAHPNVTIEITVLENDAFKTKIATVMQSGNPPDLFQSWGGGVMAEYAKAGLLRDITKEVKDTDWGKSMAPGVQAVYAYDGKQYGMPYDMGGITFWYNKEILAKAGYSSFPTTWSEFMAMIPKIKALGVAPIAVAGGEKWPCMYWWAYLAMRLGGREAFDKVLKGTGSFNDAPFVKAGELLAEMNSLKPFQDGFLGATYPQQAGFVGDGKAAMELMGQWAPQVEMDSSVSKTGIGDKLAAAAFPAVEGGMGAVTDVTGGGNGYIVGKNASDAAVDFLKTITSLENNTILAGRPGYVPTVIGAEVGIKNPNLKMVKEIVDKASYYQLYLDQFFPPSVGPVINDSVQGLLAGTLTPVQVCAAIQKAYADYK